MQLSTPLIPQQTTKGRRPWRAQGHSPFGVLEDQKASLENLAAFLPGLACDAAPADFINRYSIPEVTEPKEFLSLWFAIYSPILLKVSSPIGFTPSDNAPRPLDRYASTVAICAAVIVAVRIARLSEQELNIRRLESMIEQSVRLAITILDTARRIC